MDWRKSNLANRYGTGNTRSDASGSKLAKRNFWKRGKSRGPEPVSFSTRSGTTGNKSSPYFQNNSGSQTTSRKRQSLLTEYLFMNQKPRYTRKSATCNPEDNFDNVTLGDENVPPGTGNVGITQVPKLLSAAESMTAIRGEPSGINLRRSSRWPLCASIPAKRDNQAAARSVFSLSQFSQRSTISSPRHEYFGSASMSDALRSIRSPDSFDSGDVVSNWDPMKPSVQSVVQSPWVTRRSIGHVNAIEEIERSRHQQSTLSVREMIDFVMRESEGDTDSSCFSSP